MPRPKRIILCATCSRPFQARRVTTKYCSRPCRDLAHALPLDALLWPHVEKTEACWLFRGRVQTREGYGRLVQQNAKQRRFIAAHRAAWILASGAAPPSDVPICHTCDVRLCVRNDEQGIYVIDGIPYPRYGHLFLGSPAANNRDRDLKGRNTGVAALRNLEHRVYARGERSRSAKLTPDLVRDIRTRKANGESYRSLSRAFGLNTSSLWQVVHRETWTHVD